MPKKSKRIASRHAQLSGRGRRAHRHGPTGIPTDVARPPVPVSPADNGAAMEEEASSPTPQSQRAQAQEEALSRTTPPPQSRRRGAARPSPATYFWREMRRIGLVTGLILAILIVLTFALQ